jgi:hypothetical protein
MLAEEMSKKEEEKAYSWNQYSRGQTNAQERGKKLIQTNF